MGKRYEEITPKLKAFIEAQQLFFVGSAPLAGDGHVNVSPKGMDSLRVLDAHTVAYLDLTGSGAETIAHVKENGRLVIMFCAFEGSPLIVRLHGKAEVLEVNDPGFDELRGHFGELPAVRSIIRLTAERITDSCGWTVPEYQHVGERPHYQNYVDTRKPGDLREGQLASNMTSIDGLPALSEPSC